MLCRAACVLERGSFRNAPSSFVLLYMIARASGVVRSHDAARNVHVENVLAFWCYIA